MIDAIDKVERRTSADVVFDQLYEEIVSLSLLPGARLSEADVARRFGVSRQPVRDAFSRLGNIDLLLIRPQRATIVRGFSIDRINHSRFVRLAIELEVITAACQVWDKEASAKLQSILDKQQKAIESAQSERFHALDLEFHQLICTLSGHPKAADNISECKQEIDRLCLLSLGRADEAATLLDDHVNIAKALESKSVTDAVAATRTHLGRLGTHIDEIYEKHREYFE